MDNKESTQLDYKSKLSEVHELILLKKHGILEHRAEILSHKEEILKLVDEINELNDKYRKINFDFNSNTMKRFDFEEPVEF